MLKHDLEVVVIYLQSLSTYQEYLCLTFQANRGTIFYCFSSISFVCARKKNYHLQLSSVWKSPILFLINVLCVILLKLTSEFNLNFSLCSRNPKEENYELYCLKFPTSTHWRRRGLLSTTPTRCSWLASKAKPWVTWWDRGMQPREHDKKPVEVFIFQFSKSSTHRDNVMKLKNVRLKTGSGPFYFFLQPQIFYSAYRKVWLASNLNHFKYRKFFFSSWCALALYGSRKGLISKCTLFCVDKMAAVYSSVCSFYHCR